MKNTHSFFKYLFEKEKALLKNPALAKLLEQALFDCGAEVLPELKRHVLLVETGHVYQHFGFCVFGPAARSLLADYFHRETEVPRSFVTQWLDSLSYILLEDMNILKLVTGEPDWNTVDEEFFKDLARRILCVEREESAELGLDLWCDEYIGELCLRSCYWVSGVQSENVESVLEEIRGILVGYRFADILTRAMSDALLEISRNPIKLLLWRMNFLVSFADARQESRLVFRGGNLEDEQENGRLAALLTLLLPHRGEDGALLLPPSPITRVQLRKVLRSSFQSEYFDCSLLRTWLDVTDENLDEQLNALLKSGVDAGLLFEVPIGKTQTGFGLARSAIRVLKPFQKSLTAMMLKSPETESSESAGGKCLQAAV